MRAPLTTQLGSLVTTTALLLLSTSSLARTLEPPPATLPPELTDLAETLDDLGSLSISPELSGLLDALDDIGAEGEEEAVAAFSPGRTEAPGRATLGQTRSFHNQISNYLWRGSGLVGEVARQESLTQALIAAATAVKPRARTLDDGVPVYSGHAEDDGIPSVSASLPSGIGGWHAFVQGNIGYGAEHGSDGRPGQRWWTRGVVAGADLQLAEDTVVGLAAGWDYADATEQGGGDHATGNVHTGRIGPYVGFARGAFELDGGLSWGLHWIDDHRTVLGSRLESEHDAWDVAAHGSMRLAFERGRFRFGPVSQLHWVHLEEDSFSENGVGGLSIGSRDTDSLSTTVGGHFAWDVPLPEMSLVLEARAGWTHEYLDDANTMSARFAGVTGSDFRFRLPEADRDGARMGLSATLALREDLSLEFGWQTAFSQNVESHIGSLRADWRF